ncbi:MAG: hypothetical protein IKS17_03445 [Firmicutes bacterium]|nr:hypothetical protein [Bacillota bacterium]
MNIIKTHTQTVIIDNKPHTLIHSLTEKDGVFGVSAVLGSESAADTALTDSYTGAKRIFDIMCKEQVLPLNLYSVIDDMYGEDIGEAAAAKEG